MERRRRKERLSECANDGQYEILLRRLGAKRNGEWDDELVSANEWLPPGGSAFETRVRYPDEAEDDDRMEEDDEIVE